MQARYYDPGIGRFVSEDPKHSGNDWYTYCEANPTNVVDQTGRDGIGILEILIGGMCEGLAGCCFLAGAAPLAWFFVIFGSAVLIGGLYIEWKIDIEPKLEEIRYLIQRQIDSAGEGDSSPGLSSAGLSIALHMVEIDILCNSIDN